MLLVIFPSSTFASFPKVFPETALVVAISIAFKLLGENVGLLQRGYAETISNFTIEKYIRQTKYIGHIKYVGHTRYMYIRHTRISGISGVVLGIGIICTCTSLHDIFKASIGHPSLTLTSPRHDIVSVMRGVPAVPASISLRLVSF